MQDRMSISLSRRAMVASAVGAVAVGQGRSQAGADAATITILQLQRRDIEVNGKSASVYGIRQPNGAPGLVTSVGKRFRVRVENQIDAPSLIHWHGLTPPWQQDGVPGISGPPIPPGKSADYDFPLTFGGTFWMHSHEGLQEQLMMSAPLIIHDERDEPGQQGGMDVGRRGVDVSLVDRERRRKRTQRVDVVDPRPAVSKTGLGGDVEDPEVEVDRFHNEESHPAAGVVEGAPRGCDQPHGEE